MWTEARGFTFAATSSLELSFSPLSQKRLSPYVIKSTPPLKKKMEDVQIPRKLTGKRKRRLVARAVARKGPKVYSFKRTYNIGTGTTNALLPTLTGQNYSLNDLPGYLEFTNLFDYYKITGSQVDFYQTHQINRNLNNAVQCPWPGTMPDNTSSKMKACEYDK